MSGNVSHPRDASAESRHAIGWVIVGGMSLGTVLTLFVVPTAYTLLARDRNRHREADEPFAQPASGVVHRSQQAHTPIHGPAE